jgi:hypothetical protein
MERQEGRKVLVGLALLGSVVAAACSSQPSGTTSGAEEVGVVRIALDSVPANVSCVSFTVTGLTTAQLFDVVANQRTLLTITGVPTGFVAIDTKAFAETCANLTSNSVATWVGDEAIIGVTAGIPADVAITMRPNNTQVDISLNFTSACQQAGVSCASGDQCCGQACSLAPGANFGNCGSVDPICVPSNVTIGVDASLELVKIRLLNPDGTAGTCTDDCSVATTCGIANLGKSVFCPCTNGAPTICSCPRPAAYPGAAIASQCVDSSGAPTTATATDGTPCNAAFDECWGPVSSGAQKLMVNEGCVCLADATGALNWSCGPTWGWFTFLR